MKVIKRVIENISWAMDDYCCEKMEHAVADEFILIDGGQTQLENGNYISYCPFCGEKIENKNEEGVRK